MSTVGLCSANTIRIHSVTTDKTGDGIIHVYNTDDNLINTMTIHPGSDVTIDTKSYGSDINHIDFQAIGRHKCYNSNLFYLNNWINHNIKYSYDKRVSTDVYCNVWFYNKSCYYNKIEIPKVIEKSHTNYYWVEQPVVWGEGTTGVGYWFS